MRSLVLYIHCEKIVKLVLNINIQSHVQLRHISRLLWHLNFITEMYLSYYLAMQFASHHVITKCK